jgi:hypothetical protein
VASLKPIPVEQRSRGSAFRGIPIDSRELLDAHNTASACRFIAVVVSVVALKCGETGFAFVVSDDMHDLVDTYGPSEMDAVLRHDKITAAAWPAESQPRSDETLTSGFPMPESPAPSQ